MHVFFFREAWRSFTAHRGLALTAIFSMTAALSLCGLFVLLSYNAGQALRAMGDRREMIVYLKDEVSEPEVQAVQGRIAELYGLSTFVSRAQAWEEFSQQVGDPELLRSVDTNPLPASLHIKLKPELQNFASMEQSAKQIEQFPEVEAVRFGAEWVRRLDDLNASARQAALLAGLAVALAIVFVLFTTLRLSVLARRAQVDIMIKLGARDRFVITPFLIEAVGQTLVSALMALGLLFAVQQALAQRITGITFLPPLWMLAFALGSVLLAWIASAVALSRILRTTGA